MTRITLWRRVSVWWRSEVRGGVDWRYVVALAALVLIFVAAASVSIWNPVVENRTLEGEVVEVWSHVPDETGSGA